MTESTDGFPVFQDGDVEIRLSRKLEDRFVLHSVVLGLHSSFFKASISERWSARNDDATSGDQIKWRYQLLFDEDMNDEDPPLLAKAPETFLVSGFKNLPPDTASIFLMEAPYVPSDDSKSKPRLAWIRAHRHYLETLYHKTPQFATDKFPELVDTTVQVLRVAELYGSLAVFKMPVDTVFALLKSDLDRLCGINYFNIIRIAMLARSSWLFQYVICRLVGDPTWTDDRIRETFETLGVVPLVLEKRGQLRDTMLQVDHTIMLAGVPVSDEWIQVYRSTATIATAAYQLRLVEHIEEHNRGGWNLSSEKYRILKDEGEGEFWPSWRSDGLLCRFGYCKVSKIGFNAVLDGLRRKVGNHVSPLLVDHAGVDRTIPPPDDVRRKDHGLTCVKITDDDLPWKGVPW